MFRRLFQFSVPSALGVCLAGLMASLAETALHSYSLAQAIAGAGFLMLFAVPIGFALSLLGRATVRAWNLETLLASMTDDRGASPRLAAWAVFLVLAILLLLLGSFQGMRLLFSITRINTLVALGAPVLVVAIVLLLVALSRPLVNLLELPLARIERGRVLRSKAALLTPVKIAITIAVLCLLTVVIGWLFFLLPNIGHLDISFVFYLTLFVVGLIGLPALYRALTLSTRSRRVVAIVLCTSTLVCVATAQWTRYQRPYRMLERRMLRAARHWWQRNHCEQRDGLPGGIRRERTE